MLGERQDKTSQYMYLEKSCARHVDRHSWATFYKIYADAVT